MWGGVQSEHGQATQGHMRRNGDGETRGATTKAVDRAAGTRDLCSQNDLQRGQRNRGKGQPSSWAEDFRVWGWLCQPGGPCNKQGLRDAGRT